jgi:hypothetical protein
VCKQLTDDDEGIQMQLRNYLLIGMLPFYHCAKQFWQQMIAFLAIAGIFSLKRIGNDKGI